MVFGKFRNLFVVVMACVVALAFVACDYEGGEVIRELPGPGTIEENRNPDNAVEGFLLTIAVEENVLPHGQRFQVHAELENLREEDVKISYTFFFSFHIPNWNPHCCGYGCLGLECELLQNDISSTDLPMPSFMYFPAGEVIGIRGVSYEVPRGVHTRDGVALVGVLPPGTHELTVGAHFTLHCTEDPMTPSNTTRIGVGSNTIILTVQ